MEGSRPLLVEVQALVAPTDVVPPRRVVSGIDRNRLNIVLAVLARHTPRRFSGGHGLGGSDVFVNVAGGMRVDEPGADLAVALAVASAATGQPLAPEEAPLACFGEVGLTGELRYVAHADRRLEETSRFGIRRVLTPMASVEDALPADPGSARPAARVEPARTLAQALDMALGERVEARARAA
jgi:DNA repair protein RadA/Sms